MLNEYLEPIWASASEGERRLARARAENVLANLIHYPITKKSHYDEDVEHAAAQLIAFKQEKHDA